MGQQLGIGKQGDSGGWELGPDEALRLVERVCDVPTAVGQVECSCLLFDWARLVWPR